MSDGSERKVLLACGVLDEAGREDSLERLTAGIVSLIFSNSLFAHVTGSVSGLPTLDSSTEGRDLSSVISITGLSVELSGASVEVCGATCGIEWSVDVVDWSWNLGKESRCTGWLTNGPEEHEAKEVCACLWIPVPSNLALREIAWFLSSSSLSSTGVGTSLLVSSAFSVCGFLLVGVSNPLVYTPSLSSFSIFASALSWLDFCLAGGA